MLSSSIVYVINDILDEEEDRAHPQKSKRPIACGAVSIKHAYMIVSVLATLILATLFFFYQTKSTTIF